MASMDEQILRSAKEIVVKFIEVGRISPSSFPENFTGIYKAIHDTVARPVSPEPEDGENHP